jgi:hypothetical protein
MSDTKAAVAKPTATADSPTPSGVAPALQSKEGTINAACWTKELSTKEGELFTAYDVKIDRSFKDAKDDWQHSQALHVSGERDLQNLSIVVNDMLGQIRKHKKQK